MVRPKAGNGGDTLDLADCVERTQPNTAATLCSVVRRSCYRTWPVRTTTACVVSAVRLIGTGCRPDNISANEQASRVMLSRPSSLGGLIRQSAALRSISRHPTVIGPVFGIPGSSCPSSTPSGLSLLNCSELPPSTSAGSLMRALPSSFRTSSGHRVGEGNAWHSEYPATNSTLGGCFGD